MLNKQQEQFESGVSMPELWANSEGWFNLCNIKQSALTGILRNMKICSQLFFIIIKVNQA